MSTTLYLHERRAIERNRATAGERLAHNQRVQAEREERAIANQRAFMPRKASHKQGWKRPEVRPF